MDLKLGNIDLHINRTSRMSDEALVRSAQEVIEEIRYRGLRVPGLFETELVADPTGHEVDPVKEAIFGQLDDAYKGFQTTIGQLNEVRAEDKKSGVHDKLETPEQERIGMELLDWLTPEKVAFVKEDMRMYPEVSYTLIATPNVLATPKEIEKIMESREDGKMPKMHFYSGLLKKYTAEQVSGTNVESGGYAKFKLVRSHADPRLTGMSSEQKAAILAIQAHAPFIEDTSPLEDLVFLNTLMANDRVYPSDGEGIEFFHRYFMMEPKNLHPGAGYKETPELRVSLQKDAPKQNRAYFYSEHAGKTLNARPSIG